MCPCIERKQENFTPEPKMNKSEIKRTKVVQALID